MGFVSLTEALDLTTPAGRAMAGLLAVFAAFEREILGERTRAGLAHAREERETAGSAGNRGRSHVTAEIRKLHRAGVSKSEIARRVQIGRTSVRRILGAEVMNKPKRDPVREDRIHNEAGIKIVDAGPDRANGNELVSAHYLEGKISFPFQARCIAATDVSPLRKGETIGRLTHGR